MIPALLTQSKSQIQQFLKVDLSEDFTALIGIDRVVELMEISPNRILPLPHLPPAVMGIYNWRGEILWVVNLPMLLGIKPQMGYQSCRRVLPIAIVSDPTKNDRRILGLVVDRISDMEWGYSQPIETSISMNFAGAISDFIDSRCVNTSPENLAILNIQSVLDQFNN
jgi:positive phototaxis protein PixI